MIGPIGGVEGRAVVFDGDFVDRGSESLEVIVFCFSSNLRIQIMSIYHEEIMKILSWHRPVAFTMNSLPSTARMPWISFGIRSMPSFVHYHWEQSQRLPLYCMVVFLRRNLH